MDITLSLAGLDEKPVLRNLLELYLHDASDVHQQDVGPAGLYGYLYLDHYWTDEGRYPFLIRADGRWAGFALVNEHAVVFPGARSVSEFFVIKKFRRLGVGRRVACQIFDRFPGAWEVRQLAANAPARDFWRAVVGDYTGGRFREYYLDDERWHGWAQVFKTPSRR